MRRILPVLLVSVVMLLASVPAQAATTFTTAVLWAHVGSGGRVGAGATVKSSTSTTAQVSTVCVRSASGALFDLPGARDVVLKRSGSTYQGVETLAPGIYTYWACLQVSGRRYDLSPRKKFTVPGASTTPPAPAPTPSPAPAPGTIVNLPGQPALTAYGSSTAASPYAKPGALIIAGRDQYDQQPFKDAAAAGATELIYLDAIIDASYGRYHQLLDNSSACGPATSRWPGNLRANSYGYLNDFRPGSVVQSKLRCVLETMVAENPQMGGFFMDDLGSRSWYPGFSWDAFGSANQQAYRDGAIALAQTAHDVAVEHGLMVMVNGTWAAGSLAQSGGGYPAMSTNGLSLADGGYIEHHATSELSFFTAYAKGQWGTATGSVSRGVPFMYVQAMDDATRDAYGRTGAFAYLSSQADYDTASVWGPFHPTGLPTHVSR